MSTDEYNRKIAEANKIITSIKKDLKLSDRIYRCDCGYVEDRDFNAALNLRDALTYEVA